MVADWKDRLGGVIVVVLGGGRGARLAPLTTTRSKPAVPIAGKYRLIDIPLSNAIHSGLKRILVLTQYNSVSLHRHIARTYKFDIFSRGFVQILAAHQTVKEEMWFQGTADAVRRSMDVIMEMPGEHVLILSGDHMYRMDYGRMLRDHLDNDADITLAVLPCAEKEVDGFGILRVDDKRRVVEFREKPKTATEREGMQISAKLAKEEGVESDHPYLASMGIYMFNKQRLKECLDNDLVDFGHHIIPNALENFNVCSHFFQGYWRDIGTIESFYQTHMDMVKPDADFDFYDPSWPFYTHPRYLPGSQIDDCKFSRVLVAGGAILNGCDVEESVIGVRAVMAKATVRRSYVMGITDDAPDLPGDVPALGIGENTLIENAIIDLNVRIGRNVRIVNEKGIREADGDGYVIRDGIVVVPKNTIIPDNTVI
jgi:glucose-1-phosphate adenylyltransferase